MILTRRPLVIPLAVAIGILASGIANLQGQESSPADPEPKRASVTTVNPQIPLDQLEILVRPLTKSELAVEAEAWFDLLRAKAGQIAAARLGVKKTSEAIESEDVNQASQSRKEATQVIEKADSVAEQTEKEIVDTDRRENELDPEAAATTEASEVATESATEDAASPPSDNGSVDESGNSVDGSGGEESSTEVDASTLREDLLLDVTELQSQRTALSDRLEVVLASLEKKGGDVQEYRDYIGAVSGIELDTSDVSSAWSGLVGWLRSKEGGQRWAWNLVRFFAILFVTGIAAKSIARIVNWLLERKVRLSQLAERMISRTIANVVLVIGFAIALTALEIDITPIIAAIGATGLVVGLALQGTLSNFASGLLILINRPFDVGDVVTAGGVTGKIDQMNLVSTRFRTFDNQTIYVPNNEIWNNVITNITANDTRRVDLEFGIGYDDDFERAEAIIRDVVVSHELVLDDPEPVVVTHALADSSVNIVCRPWAKTDDWWKVKTDVTREVKKRFDQEGITIPYPQQDIHVHTSGPLTTPG